jgi:hypothetical protein
MPRWMTLEGRRYQIIGGVLGGLAGGVLSSVRAPEGEVWHLVLASPLLGFAVGTFLGGCVDWLGKRAEAEAKKKFGS